MSHKPTHCVPLRYQVEDKYNINRTLTLHDQAVPM